MTTGAIESAVSKIGDAGACRRSATAAAAGPRVRLSALRSVLALLAVIAAVGLIGPMTSADAEVAHVFSTSFAVTGNPVSVAVDESTGNVYVLNSAGNVLRYDASGNPVNFASVTPASNSLTTGCTTNCRQIAVDNSGQINQGVFYVSTQGAVSSTSALRVFVPSGRPGTTISNSAGTSGLIEPFCGVAVDPAGVVYSTHSGNNSNPNFIRNIVNTYKPGQILPDAFPAQTWPFIATLSNVANPNPCRAAVDSNDHLYVTPDSASAANQFLERQIIRFTVNPFNSSEPPGKLVDSSSTGLAVDQSGNDLYSNHKTSIARYDEHGDLRETFGAGKLVESGGIAVNGSNGTVYAANRLAGNIQVFTTVVTPNINLLSATASQTTAALAANVDTSGAGNITGCEFEYGTTTAYASPKVPCSQALPYGGQKDVSAALSGLSKETTYHYRLAVQNANGTTLGPDRTFTTHNVAGVSTNPPTDVTQTTATLNGSFLGNGQPTTYYFEWGPTSGYGNTTSAPPGESAGEPTELNPVSAPITGLSVYLPESAPYHFRLVAVNASGTTFGPDRMFFAAPPTQPGVGSVGAGEVTPVSASISAQINPHNGPTVYSIEYGLDKSYESATTPSTSIGNDEAEHAVSSVLTGLTSGQTYHFRIVASNFGGVSFSSDQTFDTPAAPVLSGTSSSGIGQNSARIGAQVNPGFSATRYHFDYGLTRSYGSATPERVLGSLDNTLHPIQEDLTGLRPGVIYHYHLVATNAYGTAEGPDELFTTQPIPPKKEARHEATQSLTCKKGLVRRHGKCVKKRKHKRHNSKRQGGR